nr:MAG TPA: hypothetical protein [Caudoviricetes sp.]
MNWRAVAIYILLLILFLIVIYGLIIGGILGFLHLLMGVFNLGF